MFKNGLPKFMYDADNGTQIGSGGAEDSKVENNGATNEDTKNTNEQPLTLEAVQKMIQSETDKVRGEYSKKLKDKDKELEDIRLSSMTEEQRKAEEIKKAQSELEKQRAELTVKTLALETVDLLKANELPLEAKDFLIGKDSDTTKANIEAFKTMFATALEAEVQKRFQSTGKEHVDSNKGVKGLTRDDVAKMSVSEINANWETVQRIMNNK